MTRFLRFLGFILVFGLLVAGVWYLGDSIDKYVLEPAWDLAKLLILLLAIPLAVIVAYRIYRLYRRARDLPQLVFTDFSNNSGISELDPVAAAGFRQLFRENLVIAVEGIDGRVQKRKSSTQKPPLEKAPLNSRVIQDTQLRDLVNALAEASPEPIKPVVQLLSLVVPPRGTTITGNLQRAGSTPGKLGLTLEIADIEDPGQSQLRTIWEQPSKDVPVVASSSITEMPNAQVILDPRRQAQPYYRLGRCLASVGLFEDAIGYLKEALKLDSGFKEVAAALAENESNLQVQKGNASVYAVGKTLQDAGLPGQAIDAYRKPLLPKNQTEAKKTWKTALHLTRGDEANAYRKLAAFYRQDRVFLYDESLALYKLAVEKGAPRAVDELSAMQQNSATELTRAGQLLRDLTKYDAAEKYLLMALGRVPDHKQALAELAAVKQSKPPVENLEAQALFTLGTLYENRGALEEAKTAYEDALKKQPTHAEAKNALERVIQSVTRTPSERYIALLKPGAQWLALELSKETMLSDVVRGYRRSENGRPVAEVYNFIGASYLLRASVHSSFYQLAIDNFKQAVKHDPGWYLPYENLGDTYSYMGNQREALGSYDTALEQVQADLKEEDPQRQETECRLRISKGIAQLLSSDSDLKEKARNEIRSIERACGGPVNLSARSLYNLACWYSVAARHKIRVLGPGRVSRDLRRRARRFLAYSLAKNYLDRDLWERVDKDQDLDNDTHKGLEDLKFRIIKEVDQQKRQGTTLLFDLSGDDFRSAMTEVMKRAGWP
jgi:tetratricopeptide (TPR) repeat protein